MKTYKALDQVKKKWEKENPPCTCNAVVKCKNCEKKDSTRTYKQNRSIHKWFDEIATECRDKGITIKILLDVFKNEGIYPDKETIKLLFQFVAKAMFEKSKTSELTTAELTKTAEQFTVAMAKSGIETPFPSIEQMDNYLESYEYRG